MAKRATPRKKADVPTAVIEAAMKLAGETGWRDLSLADIAEEAKLKLSEVYPHFSSKSAILSAFARRIDQEVLAGEEPGSRDGPARDRLFEVLMRRFDALQPYRKAIAAIALDQARDPFAAVCGLHTLRRSMTCMLEAADLSAEGCRGLVRIKGLSLIYLATLRVFLKDESADLSKTMAALDKHLQRAEGLMGRFRPRGPAQAAA